MCQQVIAYHPAGQAPGWPRQAVWRVPVLPPQLRHFFSAAAPRTPVKEKEHSRFPAGKCKPRDTPRDTAPSRGVAAAATVLVLFITSVRLGPLPILSSLFLHPSIHAIDAYRFALCCCSPRYCFFSRFTTRLHHQQLDLPFATNSQIIPSARQPPILSWPREHSLPPSRSSSAASSHFSPYESIDDTTSIPLPTPIA